MTAIAGFIHEGAVWFGGDSAGLDGWTLTVRADGKVFSMGEFVFGFTTSFRFGQIVRYAFEPPVITGEPYAYMVTPFIDALRAALKAGGYAKFQNGQESAGAMLVGFRGGLYKIGEDYEVGESAAGYDACGCGKQVVLGALYATRGLAPKARMITVMDAAEMHCAAVRRPFHWVCAA